MSRYQKDMPSSIQALFDNIASRYDVANSLMSFHLHALWNRKLAKTLVKLSQPKEALDLCAGTGEIALAIHRYLPTAKIHLVDFSEEMLQQARKKASGHPFTFSQGDATALTFQENSFDAISIAYGIRNVYDVRRCIQEAFRVLKPGGWLGVVELTRPQSSILRPLHSLYLHSIVPLIGKWAVRNGDAYSYLCKSIHSFICPKELIKVMKEEGFSSLTSKSLTGGIATLIFAQKGPAS